MKNIATITEILMERIKLIKIKWDTLTDDEYLEAIEKLVQNQEELDVALTR